MTDDAVRSAAASCIRTWTKVVISEEKKTFKKRREKSPCPVGGGEVRVEIGFDHYTEHHHIPCSAGFIFVRTFFFKLEKVHLFSSSLPRFDKCQETSRIFPRTEQTFANARSFGVIS